MYPILKWSKSNVMYSPLFLLMMMGSFLVYGLYPITSSAQPVEPATWKTTFFQDAPPLYTPSKDPQKIKFKKKVHFAQQKNAPPPAPAPIKISLFFIDDLLNIKIGTPNAFSLLESGLSLSSAIMGIPNFIS